jgi:uncharacterized protein (DUF1330 family)
MNKGYCIVLLDIEDEDLYVEYARRATEIEAKYGGRALVAADADDVIEGKWPSQRVVVLEFPSLAVAKQWYSDPEYSELIPLRQRATSSTLLFVEGLGKAD